MISTINFLPTPLFSGIQFSKFEESLWLLNIYHNLFNHYNDVVWQLVFSPQQGLEVFLMKLEVFLMNSW